jgi:hypothetical protein
MAAGDGRKPRPPPRGARVPASQRGLTQSLPPGSSGGSSGALPIVQAIDSTAPTVMLVVARRGVRSAVCELLENRVCKRMNHRNRGKKRCCVLCGSGWGRPALGGSRRGSQRRGQGGTRGGPRFGGAASTAALWSSEPPAPARTLRLATRLQALLSTGGGAAGPPRRSPAARCPHSKWFVYRRAPARPLQWQ